MGISKKDKLLSFLNKNKIKAKKSLGQNFLIDDNVLDQIIQTASIGKEDFVLEIGPGPGALTEQLLESAKHVFIIEKDDELFASLSKRHAKNPKLTLFHADALTFPFEEELSAITQKENKKIKVVANLPYNIATPILMNLLRSPHLFEGIFVMLQKEVAKRICSPCKSRNYGFFSLLMQMQADTKMAFDIFPRSFFPPPKVMSSFIQLTPNLKEPLILDQTFISFLKVCFKQKRKTLSNNLKASYNLEDIENMLKKFNLFDKVRAEELEQAQFVSLFHHLTSI
jgi:16S rRNA (adenine1518-N6/adenine1519-N6)-dimethyltransferase